MFLLCLCDNSNFPLLHLVTVFKKENNVCSLGSSELQKILGSLYKCRMICMVQLMFKNWIIFNQHQPMKDGSAHCILCDMGMAFSDSLCSVTCSSTTESDILIYILNPDLVLQFSFLVKQEQFYFLVSHYIWFSLSERENHYGHFPFKELDCSLYENLRIVRERRLEVRTSKTRFLYICFFRFNQRIVIINVYKGNQ